MGLATTLARRSQGIIPVRANGDNAVGCLQHIAGAGYQQGNFGIGNNHQRFKLAQIAVCPPVLR